MQNYIDTFSARFKKMTKINISANMKGQEDNYVRVNQKGWTVFLFYYSKWMKSV